MRVGPAALPGSACGNEDASLDGYAWYDNNSDNKTHPVGQKKPNAWGLYDMHGNVLEWCVDWQGDYQASALTDPAGPSSGSERVFRGGGLVVIHIFFALGRPWWQVRRCATPRRDPTSVACRSTWLLDQAGRRAFARGGRPGGQ